MLTSSQKRYIEWPLLIALVMLSQILELTVNRVMIGGLRVHLIPIVISYVALTRGWGKLFALALLLAYMGSAAMGYAPSIYIAVSLWTALTVKATVYAFALEGRRTFAALAAGASAFARLLTWMVLSAQGNGLPLGQLLLSMLLNAMLVGALGYLCFPWFVRWDEYFEHEAEDARELDPNVLK